jgi:hypothetical protein
MRIGTVAVLIAVAALDLALMREMPPLFLLVPFIAYLFVSLNLVLVRFFALRRPLGPFHLGFIGAGFLYSLVTFGLRTRILETLIAWYRLLTGDTTIWRFNSSNQVLWAERGLILVLGFLSCLAGGILTSYGRARLQSRLRLEPVTTIL